jgi:ParB-like chromosome segregation protein Spo0J
LEERSIIVRRVGDHYEIIAGEHRYRALLETGAKVIHAIDENGQPIDFSVEDLTPRV